LPPGGGLRGAPVAVGRCGRLEIQRLLQLRYRRLRDRQPHGFHLYPAHPQTLLQRGGALRNGTDPAAELYRAGDQGGRQAGARHRGKRRRDGFRGGLKKEGPKSFNLAAAGKLKLPTANETHGLGTGEIDQGAGLEFAKELNQDLTLLADGYYTIIGDPEGTDFNNQLAFDIGFYRPLNGKLGLTVLYETRSALADGNADPRELSGTLDYKSADGNQYTGGLLLGLSDGSPDLGLSVGLSRRF